MILLALWPPFFFLIRRLLEKVGKLNPLTQFTPEYSFPVLRLLVLFARPQDGMTIYREFALKGAITLMFTLMRAWMTIVCLDSVILINLFCDILFIFVFIYVFISLFIEFVNLIISSVMLIYLFTL
jgi:hypothetical protein